MRGVTWSKSAGGLRERRWSSQGTPELRHTSANSRALMRRFDPWTPIHACNTALPAITKSRRAQSQHLSRTKNELTVQGVSKGLGSDAESTEHTGGSGRRRNARALMTAR